MIRFVHTADIHFGTENYGRIDAATGVHSRLLDFAAAFNFCIDYAIEHKVDFFLFCGDAYKTHHPSQTQQKMFLDCLLRLYMHNIPVVIIVGNHDHPLSFGKAHALNLFGQLPITGFYVIDKAETLVLKTKSGPVQIVGIPWPTRNTVSLQKENSSKMATEITTYIASAVASIIKYMAEKLDPTLPAVLAAHLTVSAGIFSGSEKRAVYGTDPLLMPSQLAIKPFDYVALGHLHRFQNVNPNGLPPIVYAGSVERIDFGERKEEKGFCMVTITAKQNCSYEFIKTPTRSFLYLETKLSSTSCQTEQILRHIKENAIAGAVVKLAYHVPPDRQDVVDLTKIEAALADAWYVAGITPIVQPTVRIQRGAVRTDMDFKTMLTTYFKTKPALKEKSDALIEKTLLLLQDIEENNEQSD